jgi:predicted porin
MKKNIIALAVAAAVAAPMAASADATVYGTLHLDFVNQDTGAESSLYVNSNDSRLGFKGTEDLGNGLSAIWQIENDLDTGKGDLSGGTGFSSRNTYVGLAGGWGAVIVGKHDTPYKITGRKLDMFGDTKGDFRQLSAEAFQEARVDNVVAYKLPTMGGFNLLAAYVAADNAAADNGSAYSINADWSNDMFWVGGAYQAIEEGFENSGVAGGATIDSDWASYRIGGSVKMAGFKLNAMWDSQEQDTSTQITNEGYVVGLAWSTGAHTIKGQYAAYEYDTNAQEAEDRASFSLGYDYALSKKTTAYALYTALDTDAKDIDLWKGVTGTGTDDPSAFGVGMIIKF